MLSGRNIATIWNRELKGYFYTPLAYAYIGVFSFIVGVMFTLFLHSYELYMRQTMFGMGQAITIDRLAEAFYQNLHFVFLMSLPFLTMRLFTEEVRQNTLVLYMTSPVRTTELVLAKFLAGSTIVVINLLLTLIFPVFLYLFSTKGAASAGPDLGVIFTTYTGLFLVGFAYVAIGTFWSSVTESQLVAVFLTFATFILMWMLQLLGQGAEGTLAEVVRHLAINQQFETFMKGTLELQAVVYFISLVGLFLFLTNRTIESRSWRS